VPAQAAAKLAVVHAALGESDALDADARDSTPARTMFRQDQTQVTATYSIDAA
jgi:hypothetical protein